MNFGDFVDSCIEGWRRASGADRVFADAHARAFWALGIGDDELEREVEAALRAAAADPVESRTS